MGNSWTSPDDRHRAIATAEAVANDKDASLLDRARARGTLSTLRNGYEEAPVETKAEQADLVEPQEQPSAAAIDRLREIHQDPARRADYELGLAHGSLAALPNNKLAVAGVHRAEDEVDRVRNRGSQHPEIRTPWTADVERAAEYARIPLGRHKSALEVVREFDARPRPAAPEPPSAPVNPRRVR